MKDTKTLKKKTLNRKVLPARFRMYFRRSVRQFEGILQVLPPNLRRQNSTG